MTVRLAKDELDVGRIARSRKAYGIRKKSRMENAGLESLRVSFDKVQIREYPIIMGSNPAVSQVRTCYCQHCAVMTASDET